MISIRKNTALLIVLALIAVGFRDVVDNTVKSITGLDLDNIELDIVIDAVYNVRIKVPTGAKKDGGKIG